jgi:SAM-dependent methyltransferase
MKHYRAIPEYYDAEFGPQEMLEHDVPFFLEHARRNRSILELATGTGRAAVPLAQAGHKVLGIDNDSRMLALAERKRQFLGIPRKNLRLVRADALKLNLREKFDWVCIFFNTFLIFTTLEEQDRALQVVRKHLKPRGRFWLDLFQPNLQVLCNEVNRDLEPMSFYVPEYDRTVFKTTEIRPDPAAQVQRVIFYYTWFDKDAREHRQRTEFLLAFIFPRELRLLLDRNGFVIEKLYGDYDGSPLDADSPRMIACCKQRALASPGLHKSE